MWERCRTVTICLTVAPLIHHQPEKGGLTAPTPPPTDTAGQAGHLGGGGDDGGDDGDDVGDDVGGDVGGCLCSLWLSHRSGWMVAVVLTRTQQGTWHQAGQAWPSSQSVRQQGNTANSQETPLNWQTSLQIGYTQHNSRPIKSRKFVI